ncbi:uncharacterized protein LOC117136660 [Drosophila mauritiana]|uniref:Uncharacterized protein LOC117136660 n=1 Tax=Drosophila mauritiana TaxID=7226 RepID=A0A6P8JC51_DROMA|nr:uncharacterized protein LOC117136660 [Drosophila mauritiana]
MKFEDGSDFTKTLGLAWDPASDQLLFSFSAFQSPLRPCRRSVLSAIAKFYDPLGLVGPVITRCKIFLQQLCKEKLSWDESLPETHNTKWLDICRSFEIISHVSFPRLVFSAESDLEVHGFCDASIDAYGACVYVVSKGNQSFSHLLCYSTKAGALWCGSSG